MLTKCANPPCKDTFRYLGKGLLFRLEADPVSRSYTSYPETVQEEYFWLCPECAEQYTLHLEEGGHVCTIPLLSPRDGKSQDYATISRMDGMLLRSVSSVRTRLK